MVPVVRRNSSSCAFVLPELSIQILATHRSLEYLYVGLHTGRSTAGSAGSPPLPHLYSLSLPKEHVFLFDNRFWYFKCKTWTFASVPARQTQCCLTGQNVSTFRAKQSDFCGVNLNRLFGDRKFFQLGIPRACTSLRCESPKPLFWSWGVCLCVGCRNVCTPSWSQDGWLVVPWNVWLLPHTKLDTLYQSPSWQWHQREWDSGFRIATAY